MDVGFIGLGGMGIPMAANLAASGHAVRAWNRSPKDLPQGVSRTGSAADLARFAPVVVVMVNGPESVDDVLFGDEGWLAGAQPGHTVVQSSTIGPQATAALAQRLGAQAIRLVDAPVSGSTQVAKDAELVVLAGADAEDLAAVTPVLEAMSRRIIHAGPVGAGSALKLVVNAVLITSMAASAEALRWLGDVEPVVETAVAAAGLERVAPLASRRAAALVSDTPGSGGYRVEQALKDLDLLGGEVREGGVLDAVRTLYREAAAAGWGDRELSAVGAHLRSLGG
jgi:2-hydroxy-3-oxopropionate reductase